MLEPSDRTRFWCGDPPCKVTTWSMHALPEVHDLELVWQFQKVRQRLMLTWNSSEILMWRTPLHTAGNSWGVITFTRQFDLGLIWEFKKVRQCPLSCNICVQLLHNVCLSWGVIWFTRKCDLELVRKFKQSHKDQCQIKSVLWCGKHRYKVTTSCMPFLMSYCIEEASWPSARSKVQKGQTMINGEHNCDFYMENISVMLPHDS